MRHRRKGRQLGRSSSHRKAMLKNLATSLFLTLRDDMYYEGLYQADGTTQVKPPKHKGRVTTTLHKAKEVRPLVEKCVTLAKKALPHIEAADALNTDADRGTEAWKTWREGEGWQKWNAAIAPAINYRRRAYALLGDKEAVSILFEDVAPQFTDRPGGYTRVLKLAGVRLGDAGAQAVIEFVGKNDRVKQAATAVKPAFADDSATKEEEKAEEVEAEAKEEADAATEAAPAEEAAPTEE
jgi:large subunit ribosomal protein L17